MTACNKNHLTKQKQKTFVTCTQRVCQPWQTFLCIWYLLNQIHLFSEKSSVAECQHLWHHFLFFIVYLLTIVFRINSRSRITVKQAIMIQSKNKYLLLFYCRVVEFLKCQSRERKAISPLREPPSTTTLSVLHKSTGQQLEYEKNILKTSLSIMSHLIEFPGTQREQTFNALT